MTQKHAPTVRTVVLAALTSAGFAAGCAKEQKLKAFDGELQPQQMSELVLDTRSRLVSIDGKRFVGATDDDEAEKARAIEDSGRRSGGPPVRYIQIPAGRHEVVVGLAKQIVPISRDTHMAVVLLTRHVEYTKRLYPGSSQNFVIRFEALPEKRYSIRPKFERPKKGEPERWSMIVREWGVSKPWPSEVIRTVASDTPGTPLSPEDWAEKQRQEKGK